MQLWIECPDCKGTAGHFAFEGKPTTWAQRWVPCEPCGGKGRVPLADRQLDYTEPVYDEDGALRGPDRIGPIDDIEEECTRG